MVRVGSAACTAFIGSFFAAVACRRAAALSGVISELVVEVQAAAALQLPVTLVPVVKAPFVEQWLLQAVAALMYQNASGGGGRYSCCRSFVVPGGSCCALSSERFSGCAFHPVCRFLLDPGGLDSGFEWACSGASDLEHATYCDDKPHSL